MFILGAILPLHRIYCHCMLFVPNINYEIICRSLLSSPMLHKISLLYQLPYRNRLSRCAPLDHDLNNEYGLPFLLIPEIQNVSYILYKLLWTILMNNEVNHIIIVKFLCSWLFKNLKFDLNHSWGVFPIYNRN